MIRFYIFILLSSLSASLSADEFVDFDKEDASVQAQEYYEANIDVDGDGSVDVNIYSEPTSSFGNAGGGFTVNYKNKEGTNKRVKVFGHSRAFRIENLYETVRLWVYNRANSSEGIITVYDLSTGEEENLSIHSKEQLGEQIYNTVFSESSRVKFTLEK